MYDHCQSSLISFTGIIIRFISSCGQSWEQFLIRLWRRANWRCSFSGVLLYLGRNMSKYSNLCISSKYPDRAAYNMQPPMIYVCSMYVCMYLRIVCLCVHMYVCISYLCMYTLFCIECISYVCMYMNMYVMYVYVNTCYVY